jgi:UDP-2,4-diacetamido-2,4,6-trideoxy-beta-L-altropyranose hydrolase
MTLRIAFRTDASLQMGSGHVMRCLTLADALRAKGAQCHFISRVHPGHLMDVIRQRGYIAYSLVAPVQKAQEAIKTIADKVQDPPPNQQHELTHAAWLGGTWQTDAEQTADILADLQPDWLVVDHYALDQRWESALRCHFKKLMVIDDLADRAHNCDLLLDQNLGRQPQDYAGLVPEQCQVFTGPRYALLRPEFSALRGGSLKRRANSHGKKITQLLIAMGGVDLPNASGQVLEALKSCPLPADCRITVVMGATAPWLVQVRELAQQMPWPTAVLVNIADMAQHMADSDLAIGAAGSTSWERCCLGLPTLMVVLAENQQPGAQALEAAHAARLIGAVSDIATQMQLAVRELIDPACQMRMSHAASVSTDGHGVERILTAMGVCDA